LGEKRAEPYKENIKKKNIHQVGVSSAVSLRKWWGPRFGEKNKLRWGGKWEKEFQRAETKKEGTEQGKIRNRKSGPSFISPSRMRKKLEVRRSKKENRPLGEKMFASH